MPTSMMVEFTGEVPEEAKGLEKGGVKGGAKGGATELTDRQGEILDMIRDDRRITYRQLAAALGVNESAVIKHMQNLKHKRVLKRIGPARGGHWEVQE